MRHGRKSKSRTINGYKVHLGLDLDTELVLACAVTPANRPEAEALGPITADTKRYPERGQVAELYIDRGYLAADETHQLAANDTEIVCKPWSPAARDKFSKRDFLIDLRRKQITCPAGHTESLIVGGTVHFLPPPVRVALCAPSAQPRAPVEDEPSTSPTMSRFNRSYERRPARRPDVGDSANVLPSSTGWPTSRESRDRAPATRACART